MPIGFTNSGIDARVLKHFRITVNSTNYMTEEGTRGGGVTPNGNFPTTNKYFYSTNLTGGKSVTRATTDAKALNRERGVMRFEQVVKNLQINSNCEIFDVEIVEANGDAQATNLQFTVAYEDTDSIDLTGTSIDGSTANNSAILRIKELVAQGINCGTAISNDSTVASGSITELRTVFRPATDDSVVTSVTAQSPDDSGEIFDSITVAQITTTKLVSGEDS
tara:strand:+ start:82 stop:744 length:663 start_codon:yes stop_codon:yes gene_type:complete